MFHRQMPRICLAGLITCLVMVTSWQPARGAVLTLNGESLVTIVLESGFKSQTYTAAQDLAHYIHEISGANVSIVNSGQAVNTPGKIYLGTGHANLQNTFGVDLNWTGYEETLIAAKGFDLLIAGQDGKDGTSGLQRGTSQAVYKFIEDYLGVRWLWPGALGEDIEEQSTIVVNDTVDRYTPVLQQRYLRLLSYTNGINDYRGAHDDALALGQTLDAESQDWRRRQRADLRWNNAGHAFTDWYDLYGDTHPEYFALQPNGTRNPYPAPDRAKLEIANPDVADQWLADAIQQFTNKDYLLMVTASPNDSGYAGYSVDPIYDTDNWDPEPGPDVPMVTLSWAGGVKQEHVALTDRYAKFWNILAQGLKDAFPNRDVFVGTWAYEAYRTPPVETQLEDNIMVGYIGGFPMYDEARRLEERANWEGWAEQTDYLFWRPNLFYADRGMPVLFMQRSADDMSWLADHSLRGIDMDTTYGHWSLQGLQYYLMAKLAWDPYLDIEATLTDYMTRAFGAESAAVMRQYYDQLEQVFYDRVEATKNTDSLGRISVLPDFYTQDLVDDLQTLLDQAKAQVANGPKADLFLERIEYVNVGLRFTELQAEAIAAMNDLREGNGDYVELLARAVLASMMRDAFLDSQMDSNSLNTVYGFSNWAANSTVKMYYGPPGTVLIGDANNDGRVDGSDFIAVEQAMGVTGLSNGLLFGDANDDGVVDYNDYLAVEQNLGRTLADLFGSSWPWTVPEPTLAGPLLLSFMLLRRPKASADGNSMA